MSQNLIRPNAQINNIETYNDSLAIGSELESNSTSIETDIQAVLSIINKIKDSDYNGNWYDDIPTINSKQRGLLQLNTDLNKIENVFNIDEDNNVFMDGELEASIFIGYLRGAIIFQAKAGEDMSKGSPIYISGEDLTGNKPVVEIADCNDFNKMPCFGLSLNTVNANQNVSIVTFGTISGLNTSSFNQGDILYVSENGTLTNIRPKTESSLIQNIGKVIRSHSSAGSIKVGGAGRTNDVPNLNQGNVFIGDSSNCAEARALTINDISGINEYIDARVQYVLDNL